MCVKLKILAVGDKIDYFLILIWGNLILVPDIESKLKRIEEDPEGSGTSHLFNCIRGVSLQANRAFQSLFERQVCNIQILI